MNETIGQALEPRAITAIAVRSDAEPEVLADELRVAALRSLALHGPSVDDWWSRANASQRTRLILRLKRVLLELDGLSVRALGEMRWRAALGLPLALATYAITWRLRRRSRAANTLRAWRQDWRTWRRWCKRHGLPSFNPSAAHLKRFLDAYAPKHKLATIRRLGASLTAHHKAAGFPDPLGHAIAAEIWRGALTPPPPPKEAKSAKDKTPAKDKKPVDRRTIPVDQAKGLKWEQLMTIVAALEKNPDDLLAVRDAAMLCLAYDLLGRIEEVAALTREDLDFDKDGSGTACIRRSKTDQEGTGATLFVRPDTVSRLKTWFRLGGVREGALFRAMKGRGRAISAEDAPPLDSDDIRRILKKRAEEVGLDPEPYSGHSMRVGGAQDMKARGFSDSDIMIAGRWKSITMVVRYTERQSAKDGGMAKLAKIQDAEPSPNSAGPPDRGERSG